MESEDRATRLYYEDPHNIGECWCGVHHLALAVSRIAHDAEARAEARAIRQQLKTGDDAA